MITIIMGLCIFKHFHFSAASSLFKDRHHLLIVFWREVACGSSIRSRQASTTIMPLLRQRTCSCYLLYHHLHLKSSSAIFSQSRSAERNLDISTPLTSRHFGHTPPESAPEFSELQTRGAQHLTGRMASKACNRATQPTVLRVSVTRYDRGIPFFGENGL